MSQFGQELMEFCKNSDIYFLLATLKLTGQRSICTNFKGREMSRGLSQMYGQTSLIFAGEFQHKSEIQQKLIEVELKPDGDTEAGRVLSWHSLLPNHAMMTMPGADGKRNAVFLTVKCNFNHG